MKHQVLQRRISMTILTLLFIGLVPAAQAGQCSLAEASGKYGFTLNGVVILPTGAVPIAAVGRATIDSKGNMTGVEARSVGGSYADETLQGTLTVNPDCTGSVTATFYETGVLVRTSVLSIVFDDSQRQIRMVQKSLELPDGSFLPVVITVEGRKASQEDQG